MKVHQVLFGSVIALATAGALADDITVDAPQGASAVSRAQVQADVLKARASGTLLSAGEGYVGVPAAATSAVTRADVAGQVLAARASGELLAVGEADARSNAAFNVASARSRADVKAEVIAARQAGQLLTAGEALGVAHGARPPITSASASNPFKAIVELARGKPQAGG